MPYGALLTFLILAATATIQAADTPVILISVDTLRADHLSAYGYRKVSTPNIDTFAEHGTLYANADAQVPLTLPSHTSLFTSTYPFQNQIEENAQRVPPGQVTLAGVLREHGYKTAAFIGSVFLEKEMGLDQGFEFYDSPFHYAALSPLSGSVFFGGVASGPNVGKDRRDAPLVTRAALQWIRQNQAKPTFAFLHLYDLHQPYRLQGYDAELQYVDQAIGNFRKGLEAAGLWDRALVILVSDHGESLGEHGEGNHGYFIYEATLHVPLIVHWPKSEGGTQMGTSSGPVGLIDLAPTILNFLQIPIPPTYAGKSFLRDGQHQVYGESLHAHDSFGWSPLRSIREGFWKFIEAPRPELYDLTTDPHELRNVIATHPQVAADLRNKLRQVLTKYPPSTTGEKPQQNQALLNSLGYLSSSPASSPASGQTNQGHGADPKDRLPEFHQYEDAIVLLAKGRLNEAIATLKALIARDPGNTLARRDLGACYLERKDYTNARIELEKVSETAHYDYATQYQLGLAYKNLKQWEKAVQHLNLACHLAPDAEQCRKQLEEVQDRK